MAFLGSEPALAYQTASEVSDECHEAITFAALARIRRDFPSTRVNRPPSREERALINDAPFPLPHAFEDIAAVTLVLGNRDIDLQGNDPGDLDSLARVHGSARGQRQHCLREPEDDGEEGNTMALQKCRSFILERVDAALRGLDDAGSPDLTQRTAADIPLDIRGSIELTLPTYYLEMGRALHTLQDAFSHHFRTADSTQVTAVLNYVDLVEDRLDERRDGPEHSSPMDQCSGLDAYREDRLAVAARASVELLAATLTEGATRVQRINRVETVLDRYLSFRPGCSASNNWCDARELTYAEDEGCVCHVGRSTRSGSRPVHALLTLIITGLWAQRRHSRCRAMQRKLWVRAAGLMALLCAATVASRASAQSQPSTAPEPLAPSNNADAPASTFDETSARPAEPEPFPFGAYLAGSGALENSALAAALGFRFRLNDHWLFGVDGEYNPWIIRRSGEFRSGVVNFYATAVLRFPMRFERINLRTSVHAGMSRLLFDLVGAPEGSIGPYFGVNLLGVDVELSRSLYLVIDPADIAIPIPQTTGVPFAYPQYRITIGLQLGA